MKWQTYEHELYRYYCKHTASPVAEEMFKQEVIDYKSRTDRYLVYVGYSRKDANKEKIIYVGTTIQHPMSRWFYHSIHGKNLLFEEFCRFDNEKEMLAKEFELIVKYHPSCNKITKRPQNFNVTLSEQELDSRRNNPEWCQCCLRRHVNKGYRYCLYCSRLV